MIASSNAGDSTDCADILISDDTADELINIPINSDDSTDCADNSAGGLIATIKTGHMIDFTDISTSDDEAEEFIAADTGKSTECADTNTSYDNIYGLIMLMG